MGMKLLCCMLVCFALKGYAQQMSTTSYIETYKEMAIREMKRSGVPAAITLAQGLLETESGNSNLVKRSNNHFGIKCKSNWTGEYVFHDDDELGECFRKYGSAEESYRDHSDFLRCNKRYAFLFELKPTDYKAWAYGLKKAGYATNPRYPDILIRHIEQYELYQYNEEYLEKNKDLVDHIGSNTDSIKLNQESSSPVTVLQKTTYNGLKACYAEKGSSLLAIANRFDLGLSRLLGFNDLKADGLLASDCWLYLEKKPKEASAETILISKDESIHNIAQRTGVQLNSILAYNGLNEDATVLTGTRLRLKPIKIAKNTIPVDEGCIHRVQKGDSLYEIARKYGITTDELISWNSLTDNNLRVGQVLIISK
jgi:LysM repeat protein